MLTTCSWQLSRAAFGTKQRGIVLMMALIVLVAMTLAGIALVRSVDTSNVIAGNLAFQQAATLSADAGTQTAVAWLQTNNAGTTLHANIPGQGYSARRQDPAAGQTWANYWNTVLVPAGQVVTLATDATGNTAAYTIQRLCNAVGDPVVPATDCTVTRALDTVGTSSKTAGTVALLWSSQYYYRITTRVAGPRNTVSFVQTIVAL